MISSVYIAVSTLLLLPFAMASAAAQYHLDVTKQVSSCFFDCHVKVTNTIELQGKAANNFEWIKGNCRDEAWMNLMSECLPITCDSPPSVAYAVEYGTSFCQRGGADNVVIPIPQDYLDSPNGTYFKSEGYLNSGAVPNLLIAQSTTASMLVTVLVLGMTVTMVL
ncbi:hypothetical protein IAR55_001101 [Kwoniella newhampshirensis]|uniref:Uncharacterized protein n=1 Tax=Kwoniella newhampshirensis TaxID=1651941 RepID=A0AAW0Z4T4_9TREE